MYLSRTSALGQISGKHPHNQSEYVQSLQHIKVFVGSKTFQNREQSQLCFADILHIQLLWMFLLWSAVSLNDFT